MLNDDDDDDYVGVGVFIIGDSVERSTGGNLSLSKRGHWLCWRRRRPLCSDAFNFVVFFFLSSFHDCCHLVAFASWRFH